MTRRTYLSCLLLALSVPCLAVADTTIVDEDFESYTSSAELFAVWGGGTSQAQLVDETYQQFISLDDLEPRPIGADAFPSGGKGVEHIGGTVLEFQNLNGGVPIFATASQSIVLQADIFDVGNLGNKRNTVGFRNTGATNIIELGHWNAFPEELSHRAILFDSTTTPPNPNWQPYALPVELDREEDEDEITTLSDLGQAWHTYRATITPTSVTYELDIFRDGLNAATGEAGWDASVTYEVASNITGFNSLRFGGPSNVSSAGNGFYGANIYDNISLKLVDVVTALVGDYNGDNVVDAADYTLWRDTLGDSVAQGSGADGNGNGVIDQGDYMTWRDNYGMTGGLSATGGAAPEPSAILSLLAGCGLAAALRRRGC